MPAEEKQGVLPHWLRVVIIGRSPKWTMVRLSVLIVATFILFGFILSPIKVIGISMLPTYHENTPHVVNRRAYTFHEPRRGDVVAIRFSGPNMLLIKRIIGLPGETIEFRHGKAVVNGKVLNEPYVKYPCTWDSAPVKLGLDDYFVVGDNRSMLKEDHEMGGTYRERIIGRVVL